MVTDFRLHIYDTTAPPQKLGAQTGPTHDPYLQTTMSVKQRIQGEHGRWTITDANLSPDNDRYAILLLFVTRLVVHAFA